MTRKFEHFPPQITQLKWYRPMLLFEDRTKKDVDAIIAFFDWNLTRAKEDYATQIVQVDQRPNYEIQIGIITDMLDHLCILRNFQKIPVCVTLEQLINVPPSAKRTEDEIGGIGNRKTRRDLVGGKDTEQTLVRYLKFRKESVLFDGLLNYSSIDIEHLEAKVRMLRPSRIQVVKAGTRPEGIPDDVLHVQTDSEKARRIISDIFGGLPKAYVPDTGKVLVSS